MADVDLQPEARALLACARSARDPEAREELRLLVEQGIDWEWLRRSALWHGMHVIIAKRLADYCPGSVPPGIMSDLRRLYFQSTTDSMRKLGETVRVLRYLDGAGIRAVPLKGAVLAHTAYGDAGLRVSGDLDLLLAREDVERATGLLAELGYVPALSLEPRQRAALLHFHDEWVLVHGARRASLDLHWRVTWRGIACALDTRGLLARARPVEVLGHELPALCAGDLFLTLCIHGAKHDWDRLELIYSLAEVVEAGSEIDWTALLGAASDSGCRRRCLLGGILAADLLQAPVPQRFLDEARADEDVTHLAAQTLDGLFSRERAAPTLARHMRWQLRVLDGPGSRARYLLLRTFGPTPEDWAALTLPPWLYPLYYVARPPRLLVKHMGRVLRRGAGSRRGSKTALD